LRHFDPSSWDILYVAATLGDRPDPIDAPADDNVIICCSQPQGDIVIDL
jgi:hypothetical protein